ncbi:MAG: aspartate/glutamate racemase family protein, partial [Candidatus Hermodarchaeota archaeon]
KRENMRKLLLLGIKFTMKSTFYQEEFKAYGMKVITPLDKEQEEIDKIIFDELVIGILNSESKQRLLEIISNYKVDGVILGCTELPLILKQKDTKIKLLDTIEIHIDSALDYFISL